MGVLQIMSVSPDIIPLIKRKEKMKQIEHSLKFITELDENDPTAKRLLALSKESQIAMLEGMLKTIIAPKLKPILDEVNANNSFALLKVVE